MYVGFLNMVKAGYKYWLIPHCKEVRLPFRFQVSCFFFSELLTQVAKDWDIDTFFHRCWDQHIPSTDQTADSEAQSRKPLTAVTFWMSHTSVCLSNSALTEQWLSAAWTDTDGKALILMNQLPKLEHMLQQSASQGVKISWCIVYSRVL